MLSFTYFWAQGRFKEDSGGLLRLPSQDVGRILPLELVPYLKGVGHLNEAQGTKLEPVTPNRHVSASLSALLLFLCLHEAKFPWHSDD